MIKEITLNVELMDVYDHEQTLGVQLIVPQSNSCLELKIANDVVAYIEVCDSIPRLIVFADVNNDEPTHIINLGRETGKTETEQV